MNCIDRLKNKVVVNQFRQRNSRPLGPKWGLSSWRLGLWDMGSVCGHYDDSDKNDKNGKSAYIGNAHFEGALHTFWYISLPSLHDYDVKSPFSFILFFFFLLSLNEVSINSTPGKFAYTWQVKWFGIIAMKVKGPNTFYWRRFQCRRHCCELRNQRRLN